MDPQLSGLNSDYVGAKTAGLAEAQTHVLRQLGGGKVPALAQRDAPIRVAGTLTSIMRCPAIHVTTLVLSACGSAPGTRSDAHRQTASVDSVAQFLIAAAATDFHTHAPPGPAGFRDVRVGHAKAPSGQAQYRLCGQFLPAQQEGKAQWMPFVTIKTSGYEQHIGTQAAGFCQDSSVTWDQLGDLSSSLQSRLDSLR